MGRENAQLLRDLLANRGQLLQQLQGLREESAWTRPEPEEWSTLEVLQHVADVDQLAVRRFSDIQSGRTNMTGYDRADWEGVRLSLIHISEPTRLGMISYAVFCLKKKK